MQELEMKKELEEWCYGLNCAFPKTHTLKS